MLCRSVSSHLDDPSNRGLHRFNEDDGSGLNSRHIGSFCTEERDNDGASTFGGSSVTGAQGFGAAASFTTGGGIDRRNSMDPHSGKMSLLQLQRAIEKIMVSDGEMYAKLQAGLKGIHSLAKETDKLTVARDVTGATCINQYVVVKTLGRGSYGKVKLCLNTLDGQLYAVKVSCWWWTWLAPPPPPPRATTGISIADTGGCCCSLRSLLWALQQGC
jgi:hypothetical protein